jgi:hypothetical protein
MSRINPNYRDLENTLDLLDSEDLSAIEIKAKALSLEECLSFLCLDVEELPAEDLRIATKAWRRGRVSALNTAADKMFAAMGNRNGGVIALEYLRELSSTFQMEATPTTSGQGFNFNVIMPEDGKPE